MKISALFFPLFLASTSLSAQALGNYNYEKTSPFTLPINNVTATLDNDPDLTVSIKGMTNMKADTYVAIFSVTQTAKTSEEVNMLIDQRILNVKNKILPLADVKFFVDMISFVPLYEYEKEKKIFSKRTYNEIPRGFEVKKNIHIRFKDAELLNDLVATCASNEIYDLVRVDYFVEDMEMVRHELAIKAKTMLQEKMKSYQDLLGVDFDTLTKDLSAAYNVVYPMEKYQSYQAHANSSLYYQKAAEVKVAQKSRTSYYQPVMDKEFDFVLNPNIVEPVVQVMYEIKMKVDRAPNIRTKTDVRREFLLVTPEGDMKPIPFGS